MGTVNTSNSTWHVLICVVYMVATWVQSTLATAHGICVVYMVATWVQSTLATVHGMC